MNPLRLGYLASGSATSAKGIHKASDIGLPVRSAALVANNSASGALDWAIANRIPAAHLSGRTHEDPVDLDRAIRDFLYINEVELVVLSGYARLVGPLTCEAFTQRILNVHPAPLPRFGGKGMYGMAVHQSVIDSSVRQSAVTIHHVSGRYDEGAVVAAFPQEVRVGDTAESLRERIHAVESDCWVELLASALRGDPLPGLDWLAKRSGNVR